MYVGENIEWKNHTKTSSVRIDKSCTKELVNVFPGKKIPNVHR